MIKATYAIGGGMQLSLAEEQIPVNFTGEFWGDPNQSSYKYEPETAIIKPNTDVVLIGHAHPPRAGVTEMNVSLRVGRLQKVVRVIGDRYWTRTAGMISMTAPRPLEQVPLVFERAFGGWDRSVGDSGQRSFEPRNPVGTGFRSKRGTFEEGSRLPNLEDPRYPIRSYGDAPPPAGFGFVSANWQPRATYAGTYDQAWMEMRMPLLPADFDRRFFNAASSGLVSEGFLVGNEEVTIENASPGGRLSFNLPGIPAPECRVVLLGRGEQVVGTRLDTVIINTDDGLLILIWRARVALKSGPHEVLSLSIRIESPQAAEKAS